MVHVVSPAAKTRLRQPPGHSHARSSAPQCRDRYNNYAHPELDLSPCRAEEVLLLLVLHKQHGNKWTEIADEMSAAAAAAAEPGVKTRRSENWVKNTYYAKLRKAHKDDGDTKWAPLYAYQEAVKAEGRDLMSDGGGAGAAQLPGAEAAEPAVPQRRSSRITRKPRYGDYDSGEELDEEEEEEEEDELQVQPAAIQEATPAWAGNGLLPLAPAQPQWVARCFDDFVVNPGEPHMCSREVDCS